MPSVVLGETQDYASFQQDSCCCRFSGHGIGKAAHSRAEHVPWPLQDQGAVVTAQESTGMLQHPLGPVPFHSD